MKVTMSAKTAAGVVSLCLLASTVQAEQNLLWRNQQTGQNYLYHIDNTQIIQKRLLNTVADTQWHIAATPDLNGDGEQDIVWRHQTTGQNYLYLLKEGQIHSSQALTTIADLNWQIVAGADINGDAQQDIVWRNQQTGQVHVYQMQGLSKLTSYNLPSHDSQWRLVAVSDFNQDGQADLLWHHQSTGQVTLSLQQQGSLSDETTIAKVTDTQWQIAAVADFNGDQSPDLLWRHQQTGLNYLYLMHQATLQQGVAINTVPTTWDIAAVADFNQDQTADIVWRNQQTGQNYIYLMQGAQIAQQGLLNQVADLNWQIAAALDIQSSQTTVTFTGLSSAQSSYNLMQDETAQLTLTAHFSDDTQQDVTQLASWQSSQPNTVSVEAGLMTALDSGSATITASYQGKSYPFNVSVSAPVDHIQLFFEKPSAWTDCYVYIWSPEPTGSVDTGTWPGLKMTTLDGSWCVFDLPKETTSVKLVFNDGNNSNKTADLSRDSTGWYQGNQWYDTDQTIDTTAPEISVQPPAGNHEANALSVSIDLKDQDPQAKAFYTLDGSTPSAQSSAYIGPISLTQNTLINVFAVDSEGNQRTASFQYNLGADATKPTISASLASGRYDTEQSVTFTITDNKDLQPQVYYTVDGSTPSTSSTPYNGQAIAIKDISTGLDLNVQLLAIDNAGNQATASYFYRIGQAETRRDFREETIYFVMTARFFDGDPDNNRATRSYEESGNAANNDPAWRGDFQGLTAKLDYLKAMGFTAVWITPAVLNRSDYDFHGYHAYDFNRIDERLGGEAQFQRLIDELHKRDMKLILDIVLNHTSRYGAVGLQTVKYFGIQNDDWDWYYDDFNADFEYDGLSYEPNSGKNFYNGDLWTSENYLDLPGWGEVAGIDYKTGRTIYNYQWPNLDLFSDELFHTGWLKNWEDETAQSGTIHEDLPDLNTENPQVQQFLIDAYCRYINMGVDAFRIDTVKHVNRLMFNRRFIPAFKKCGGDDFYMFGEVATRVNEVWNKNVAPLSTPFYTWAERGTFSEDDEVAVHEAYDYENGRGVQDQPTSDNHLLHGNEYHTPDYSQSSGLSVIDFPMHWNFSDAGSAFNVASQDHFYNDSTWNVVYVDSHDYGPNMDNRYPGDTNAWAENMSYMWTFRGIPCLYYGSEIRFMSGAPADKGPSAPLASTGRAYYGDHIEGSIEVEDFGIYKNATGALAETMQQPLIPHLARLNRIRRAIPALQKGQYSREDIDGWIAYKRRYTDAASGVDSFALIAVSQGATFNNIPNGTYKDAVTGDVQVVSNGTLTADVSGTGNLRVYVLDLPGNPAPGKIGEDTQFLY